MVVRCHRRHGGRCDDPYFGNERATRDLTLSQLVSRARIAITDRSLVTESDAEALVAQPVLITVKRDIRSGPRDG